MDQTDKQRLIAELEGSTAAVRDAVEGVAPEELRVRPREGAWTILECVEHIGLVDTGFGQRIRNASRTAEPVHNAKREHIIGSKVPLREQRVQAPPHVVPTGVHGTVEQSLSALAESRRKLVAILEEREPDLRHMEVEHPMMGMLSGYEAFLLLASHARRHANQILEIREELRAQPHPVSNP